MSGLGGVGSRREARERALSLLYEAEAKALTPDEVLDALPMAPEAFAADLVSGVGGNRAEIDGLISRFAKGWTIERMPTIDRTLLRIGTYELSHRDDVPTGVVLSEAVELAKRYSTDDSGKFVNGLLARIAREVRPHEPASATRSAASMEDEPVLPPPRGLDLAIGAPPEGFEVELVPGEEPEL